jgi:hypothetical protein
MVRKTNVKKHKRGSSSVKSHDRTIQSRKGSVPHSNEDHDYLKINDKMRELEQQFKDLTDEKNLLTRQLNGVPSRSTYKSSDETKRRIKDIDIELNKIGEEWGMLGKKTKNYFVKRGLQIEKFIEKKTQD